MDELHNDSKRRVARSLVAALCLGGALVLTSGCTGTITAGTPVTVDGYAAVYTDEVPENIYAYPRVYYEGGYAYYVRGRWYRPYEGGWAVYQNPPPALTRYRPYVQEAPPAPRYYGPSYPQQYGPQPAPPAQNAYPPPAVRVQ